ncbi:hypothetical protein OHA02_51900 [Streptomyces phaeochromogenes]|nr:hypothetical protein [Streptomyces phaeochromogenes]
MSEIAGIDIVEKAHHYALKELYGKEFTRGDLMCVILARGGGNLPDAVARSMIKEMIKSDFIMPATALRKGRTGGGFCLFKGAEYRLTPLGKCWVVVRDEIAANESRIAHKEAFDY